MSGLSTPSTRKSFELGNKNKIAVDSTRSNLGGERGRWQWKSPVCSVYTAPTAPGLYVFSSFTSPWFSGSREGERRCRGSGTNGPPGYCFAL